MNEQGSRVEPPIVAIAPLADAIRAVSQAASQDPSAVLEELARQAEALLGCDGASIHLAEPAVDGGLVFRRVRLSEMGVASGVQTSTTWRADEAVLASLRAGRGSFLGDFQATVAGEVGEKPWLRRIGSALYAPLVAADEPLGVLFAAWTAPRAPDPDLITIADALAGCAAVAVHQARLLERAERARAELAAVFDAAEDSIFIFDEAGKLLHANRHGRERMGANLVTPGTIWAMSVDAGATRLEGATSASLLRGALRGGHPTAVYQYRDADGAEQRVHVGAAPIREADDRVRGVVMIARNITELHDAIAESARLDGAIKTARLVAHQINNQLSPVRGYGELLVGMVEGDARSFAERIVRAADAASTTVARLQRIIRFEETDQGGYQMLNLEAAAPDDVDDEEE